MRTARLSAAALCSGLLFLAACDASREPLAPLPVIPGPSHVTAPLGLVKFYSFDQPATSTSGITVTGANHVPSGFEGGAYHFDGVDDFLDLAVDVNPSALRRVTMGAWVRADALPSGQPAQVLSHDNGGFDRSIALDTRGATDGAYRFSAFTGLGVLGTGPVAVPARWVFVAASYDSAGTVKLYVDGTPVQQTSGNTGAGLSALRVGRNPAGSTYGEPFHGTIDNVFVYDRVLTDTEVMQIRAGGACAITGSCEPRRVHFYPFDTGPGNGANHGAQLVPGYQGSAYSFSADTAYLNLPINVNPSVMPQATMGAWVWIDSIATGRPSQVMSHDSTGGFGRSIALDTRGLDGLQTFGAHRLSAFAGQGVLRGPVNASTGAWTFVAAVYDGGTVTLYVDGATPQSATFIPVVGYRIVRVGRNPSGVSSGEQFKGSIDNLFVVNRALTADQIAEIRAGGACVLAGTAC